MRANAVKPGKKIAWPPVALCASKSRLRAHTTFVKFILVSREENFVTIRYLIIYIDLNVFQYFSIFSKFGPILKIISTKMTEFHLKNFTKSLKIISRNFADSTKNFQISELEK